MSDHAVTSDSELQTRVRALTQYADDPQELPSGELDEVVAQAKWDLEVRTGSTQWYSDDGVGLALVGMTCIEAKNAVENYSVSAWDVLGQTVNVTGVADPDASQFERYAEMVQRGLSQSDATDDGDLPTNVNNTAYIG